MPKTTRPVRVAPKKFTFDGVGSTESSECHGEADDSRDAEDNAPLVAELPMKIERTVDESMEDEVLMIIEDDGVLDDGEICQGSIDEVIILREEGNFQLQAKTEETVIDTWYTAYCCVVDSPFGALFPSTPTDLDCDKTQRGIDWLLEQTRVEKEQCEAENACILNTSLPYDEEIAFFRTNSSGIISPDASFEKTVLDIVMTAPPPLPPPPPAKIIYHFPELLPYSHMSAILFCKLPPVPEETDMDLVPSMNSCADLLVGSETDVKFDAVDVLAPAETATTIKTDDLSPVVEEDEPDTPADEDFLDEEAVVIIIEEQPEEIVFSYGSDPVTLSDLAEESETVASVWVTPVPESVLAYYELVQAPTDEFENWNRGPLSRDFYQDWESKIQHFVEQSRRSSLCALR